MSSHGTNDWGVDFHLVHADQAHVIYLLGALVEVGVTKHLRYDDYDQHRDSSDKNHKDDHGDVKGLVTHHEVPVGVGDNIEKIIDSR